MKTIHHKQGDDTFYLYSPESDTERAILQEFDALIYQYLGWGSKYQCFQDSLIAEGKKRIEELSKVVSTILNPGSDSSNNTEVTK